MPIGIALGIGGIGSLVGGILGSNAATSAANTQAGAANRATNIEHDQFEQIRRSLAPYLKIGTNADQVLNQLLGLGGKGTGASRFGQTTLTQSPMATLGQPLQDQKGSGIINQFQQSPSYNFQMQQGIDAIQNGAAGQTGAVSGNALKQLQTYGQGLANQDFYNWYNTQNNQYWQQYGAATQHQNTLTSLLQSLAGSGQNAAAQTGGFGTTTAQQIGQNTIGAGNALAAGQVGSTNALLGGLQGVTGLPLQYQALSYLFNGQNGGGGGQVPFGSNQEY